MDECFEIVNKKQERICIQSVLDSYKMEHEIKGKLGVGGQGVVCKTGDSKIAIKFILEDGDFVSRTKNPEAFKKYNDAIRKLILKPFPEGIHLAFPMAPLKDYAGYCMRFMDDMVPFESLAPIKDFVVTGGHRRRLALLSKTAIQLAKLHAAGIVYCDISPRNVFVTENPNQRTQNVWFIDADNAFTPGEDKPCAVYTERYVAPELLAGRCCSQESDLYSFATMAFEYLFCIHPFEGDKATDWNSQDDEDDEDDWDSEKKSVDNRYSGKYSWIEDPDDLSNHTNAGLTRDAIMDDEIFSLFHKTFSEGKNNPNTRPTALLWARGLAHVEDKNVKCSNCGMSFTYKSGKGSCPWCQDKILGEKKNILVVRKGDKIVYARELVFSSEEKGEWLYIPERVFSPFEIDSNSRPILSVRTLYENGRGLEFKLEGNSRKETIKLNTGCGEEVLLAYHILKLGKNTKFQLGYRNEKSGLLQNLTFEVIEESV